MIGKHVFRTIPIRKGEKHEKAPFEEVEVSFCRNVDSPHFTQIPPKKTARTLTINH